MAPIDKTFDVGLTVRAVTEEDFFLQVDPSTQAVDQGVVAAYLVALTGNYPGGINLTAENVPEGVTVTFDIPNPVLVTDVPTMTVETTTLAAGDYLWTVRASAAV